MSRLKGVGVLGSSMLAMLNCSAKLGILARRSGLEAAMQLALYKVALAPIWTGLAEASFGLQV